MYIRLIDERNFVSPFLDIHNDEEEFLKVIYEWRQKVWDWRAARPYADGLPLGRLDAGTCFLDMLRYLGEYYIKEDVLDYYKGHVYTTLKVETCPKDPKLRGESIEESEDFLEIKTWTS